MRLQKRLDPLIRRAAMLPEEACLLAKRFMKPFAEFLEIRLPIRRHRQSIGQQMEQHLPPGACESISRPADPNLNPAHWPTSIIRLF